jgi:hypothetical protein
MKTLAAVLLIAGLVAPAAAGEYTLANRPQVIFPGPNGGVAHVSPYPAGKRAAAIWASDACWRDCKTDCTWKMEACLAASDADTCRPHLDACDRACQRTCRTRGGPFLGFIDW